MPENPTDDPIQRNFLYHADANPIGGTINRPFNGFIPSQTSISLPIVGGFLERQRKGRKWKNIVSYISESTHVSGAKKDGDEGPFTTQVTATIEGLNILEVITADKVVGQLSVAHPVDGGEPTISVIGSQFDNLRISGTKITPVIRYDLFADHDSSGESDPKKQYPKKTWPRQEKFLEKVTAQKKQAKDKYSEKYEGASLPGWIRHHFHWIDSEQGLNGRDYIQCSLIDQLPEMPEGFPGVICGNAIYIPGFGKVFFGEVIVHQKTFTVSMVRAQLGSPVGGAISAATVRSNGSGDGGLP
ncbi:hypothetical protein H7849_02910 [Alloacidobacterium dinghuense]|uniref:Uncharacterized protein n=1 Tax=Alloacidobacterium dinghuense TaxID=2763107 RepID=A0A7G8BK84_9BACT|nr:hypothetical protein [Alloacidobacterium dinghuense]QNI32954.1 hypothetical protein H7849_02910 [Alloacidobacterium dinghuense]